MATVPYIDYRAMREFYTLKEVGDLLGIPKEELKDVCQQQDIEPRRNEIGEWGLAKYDVRKIHNLLYYANKAKTERTDDPWE